MTTSIKKHITFPPELLALAEERAATFGIGVAEYIRFLIMEDTKALVVKEESRETVKQPEMECINSIPVRSAEVDTFITEAGLDKG